ncbi:MAG: class I SAM-dependent methyltransferase [Thermoguttaceae bacterium]
MSSIFELLPSQSGFGNLKLDSRGPSLCRPTSANDNSRIELESTDCPLCGSNRRSLLVAASDWDAPPPRPCFSVVRCLDCDLCYTNPRPDASEIGRFYYDDYAPHQPAAALPKNPGAWNKRRGIIFKKQSNWERGEIDPVGECRLLDFGCGTGLFLQRMHNRGWQAVGLDCSEKVVRYVRDELKLPAFAGTLPHPVFPPGSFDLVTFWHALEHVHRPLEVLGEVRNLLAPGGKVLVAVPNIEGMPFRWFGSAWFGLDLPRHLTHFTPATLRKMLDRAGFEFEAMQMARHSYWLRQSVRLASRRGAISPPLGLLKFRLPSSILSRCCLLAGRPDSFVVMARKR